MDNVEDTRRDASLLSEMGEKERGRGRLGGWLKDECVTCQKTEWDRPERDHGGEVERSDGGFEGRFTSVQSVAGPQEGSRGQNEKLTKNSERCFADVRVHPLGDLDDLAHHATERTGALDDLETAVDVPHSIGERLALFERDGRLW